MVVAVPEVLVQQLADARGPFREGVDFDVDERGNPWRQRPSKPYGGPGPETVVVKDWN